MKKLKFKIVLFALILMFYSVHSFSQTNFGILASVGGATISNHDGSALRIGAFNIGAFAHLPVTDVIGIEGQLSYANRGDKYDVKETIPFVGSVNYDGTVNMGYVQLAALLAYATESITIDVGPYAGILMSAKDKGEEKNSGVDYDEDFKDEAESVDIGGQLEILYNFAENLGVGISVQKGLTKVWDPGPGDNPTNTYVGLVAKLKLTSN